jgi:capsule polysaccharide export protein KpsE/RkpR
MELEVQLAALKEYALPSHPMINQLAAQIREYRAQLDRLESERVGGGGKLSRVPLSKKYYPAFEEMTALQFKLLGLMRHVRVEDSVYTMLVSTLEAAKIAEVRDLPTIQVVDSAIPPTSKIRPKPLHNMLVAGVLSLLLGLFLAFSINYVEVLRAQEVASASIVDGTVAAATVEANGNGNKFETYPVSPRESERLHGPV